MAVSFDRSAFISACFYCSKAQEECVCFDDEMDAEHSMNFATKFLWGTHPISHPNYDCDGRNFVDPHKYYGEAYANYEMIRFIEDKLREE